jgi:hypothetical protein
LEFVVLIKKKLQPFAIKIRAQISFFAQHHCTDNEGVFLGLHWPFASYLGLESANNIQDMPFNVAIIINNCHKPSLSSSGNELHWCFCAFHISFF